MPLRQLLRSRVFLLVIAALCLYVVGSMFGASLQRSMTFYPTRESPSAMEAMAAEGGLERWRAHDGQALGWVTRTGNPGKPLLIFHGNAGHAAYRAGLAQFLRASDQASDWKVYILEYPGYGDRGGSPSQEAFVGAALEALENFPKEALPVVLGESIGTGVAAGVAGRAPGRLRGLVLLTPFASLVDVAAHHYPFIPVRWLMADRFESDKALQNFKGPVSFIIAADDRVTPPESGHALHDGFTGPKRLFVVEGAGHNEAAGMLGTPKWREALSFAWEGSPGQGVAD
jgi:uncharacterized protein